MEFPPERDQLTGGNYINRIACVSPAVCDAEFADWALLKSLCRMKVESWAITDPNFMINSDSIFNVPDSMINAFIR